MKNESGPGKLRVWISKVWRQSTSPLRKLPTFLIAGAQKSGTSTLFYSLMDHPEIIMSSLKEIHYFDLNYSRSVFWYRQHFPFKFNTNFKHTGEASPCYMIHPLCPERISKTTPDVKLIFLLRNPIDRAYSGYQHERRHGREELTFKEAIKREEKRLEGEKQKIINGKIENSFKYRHYSYLERGKYIIHLERFLKYFEKDQLLLIESTRFFELPEEIFPGICTFLDLKEWTPDSLPARNTGDYEEYMSKDTRKKLRTYFQPYNKKLRNRFSLKCDWS